MKKFARLENDILVEIIDEFLALDGQQIPMDLRYTKEFINDLVNISNIASTPKIGFVYKDGVFSAPIQADPILTRDEAERLRLTAYSNPITGCDRYFSESICLQAEGFAVSSVEVKDAKAKGLARKLEIQTLYPYPAE